MASGNDTVELMINILGQEGIDRLVKSTDNYKALLEDLAVKLKAGDITTDEFTRTQAKLSAEMEREQRLLDRLKQSVQGTADTYDVLDRKVGEYEVLERRVTETVRFQTTMLDQLGVQLHKNTGLYEIATAEAARMGQVAGRQGDFGRGMLQASFAVQDFTSVMGTQGLGRALASVQNNIPLLVTAMGAGAGLAGAISIVSVGVGLLVDNWGKLTGAWDDEETKKETERQKDLAKATEATADAAERLARAKGRTEREGQAGFDRAVKEFGGQAVLNELQKALVAKSGSFGAEADKQMAKNFFANLMQGNRSAHALLGDLDLRGDVGAVLRGEATPHEIGAVNAKRLAREVKERDKARKEARKEQEKKADETRKLEADFAEGAEDIARAERMEKEEATGRSVRSAKDLSRRLGRAMKEGPDEAGDHIPLMPLDASPQQAMDIMLRTNDVLLKNQEKESVEIRRFRQQLRRAQQIEARLENPPMPTGLPR